MSVAAPRRILDAEGLARTLRRMAHEIAEREAASLDRLVLVGVYTRGVALAARLAHLLQSLTGSEVEVGSVDVAGWRDDRAAARREPPSVPGSLEGRTVVLVDDVLYTGRTVRAATQALFSLGRPERLLLAVLCDRGHRELPIRADVVGKNLPTARTEHVTVSLVETDGEDAVTIEERPA
jgi:pyrimidine operon attenuation protein/uracil phosphoribosyltransferase